MGAQPMIEKSRAEEEEEHRRQNDIEHHPAPHERVAKETFAELKNEANHGGLSNLPKANGVDNKTGDSSLDAETGVEAMKADPCLNARLQTPPPSPLYAFHLSYRSRHDQFEGNPL